MPSKRSGAAADASTTGGLEPPEQPPAAGDLLLVTGLGLIRPHRLEGEESVIGRAPECEVIVDHKAVSRRHAVLRLGATVTVQDLGSQNGTRVARRTLLAGEPTVVEDGETFHIGPFSFLLVRARAAARTSVSHDGRMQLRVVDP